MKWIDLNLPITDPTWIFLIVLMIILFAPCGYPTSSG